MEYRLLFQTNIIQELLYKFKLHYIDIISDCSSYSQSASVDYKISYYNFLMYKAKLTSQSASSSARPASISSNSNLQKVHQLNKIVRELDGGKKQTVGSESGVEHGVGEKVLQALKQRIKTSYDHLYKNYPQNKDKIVKQIQTVEGNISGENVMKIKQQQVIKEKSQYDKLKVGIEEKQRKLKKLMDLKLQLSQNTLKETKTGLEHQQQLEKCLKKKQECEHSNSIICEMLKQRKQVLLTLHKRHSELIDSINTKKEKYENWRQANIKRRQMINRLQQSLKQEQPLQIPARLAQQLSSKLQQYENKYSYSNIIHHEAILEEDRLQRQKQDTYARREEFRVSKTHKYQEEKKELQKLYSIHSINNMEQYKIMRLYGAQSIEEVLNSDPEQESVRLQQLQSLIEQQIKELQDKSQSLEASIEDIISEDKQTEQSKPIDTLQQQLAQQQTKLKRMNGDLKKQKALAIHWQTIMHLINGNKLDSDSLAELVKGASGSQESPSLHKNLPTERFRAPYGYPDEGQSIEYQ